MGNFATKAWSGNTVFRSHISAVNNEKATNGGVTVNKCVGKSEIKLQRYINQNCVIPEEDTLSKMDGFETLNTAFLYNNLIYDGFNDTHVCQLWYSNIYFPYLL